MEKKEQKLGYNKQKAQKVVRVGIGALIYNRENKSVLMSKRKDTNLYAHPGGHLEMYESVQECAQREIKEETDILISTSKKEIGYHYVNYFMCCDYDDRDSKEQPIKNLEPEKHHDWHWVDIKELQLMYEQDKLFFALHDLITEYYNKSAELFYQDIAHLLDKKQILKSDE